MERLKAKEIYSAEVIQARVQELAKQIVADYTDDEPIVCVCVLRGAVLFFTDLIKCFGDKNTILDFVTLSSYENEMCTQGKVKLIHDLRENVEGKHVIVVEDIVDSGYTIDYIKKYFASKNPLSVKIACMLDKPLSRKVDVHADYIAFTLESDAYIYGYGMDLYQFFRNLNGIYEVIK